jgi:hypothetical protein
MYGISEFVAKCPVLGSCGSNQGCCGVNVMKAKDRAGIGIAGALSRV